MKIVGIGQTLPKIENNQQNSKRFDLLLDETQKKIISNNHNVNNRYKVDFELQKLTCPNLETDSKFLELKKKLEAFEKETQKINIVNLDSQNENLNQLAFDAALFNCLQRLISEIILTYDPFIQKEYLNKVYKWFMKKQEAKSKVPKLWPTSKNSQIQPSKSTASRLDLRSYSNKKMYEEKLRTLHLDINPPNYRLEKMQHKTLKKDNEKSEINKETNQKSKESENNKKMKLSVSKNQLLSTCYTKENETNTIESSSNFYNYRGLNRKEDQRLEKFWFSHRNKEIQDKRTNEEIHNAISVWSNAKSEYNANVVRKYEMIKLGSNFNKRNYSKLHKPEVDNSDQNLKEKYNKESNEQNHFQGIPNQYHKEEEKSKEENIHLENNNVESNDRFSTIINHRNLTLTDKNTVSQLNIATPLQTVNLNEVSNRLLAENPENPENPENSDNPNLFLEISKMRIDRIREKDGKLVSADNNKMDNVDNIYLNETTKGNAICLSAYNYMKYQNSLKNSRNKDFYNTSKNPFTHRYSRNFIRTIELDEIHTMFNEMKKNEVPCSGKTLSRVILTPEGYTRQFMKYENIIAQGSRLLVNPYIIKGKKKKGKKKKKK